MTVSRRNVMKAGLATGALIGAPAYLRAQSGPIQIGAMLPLSGPQAQAGEASLAGARVAVAMFNEAGGLKGRTVDIVQFDDKGTAQGAVAALREMESKRVNLLVGGIQSPMAFAILPALPEAKAVCVGSASAISLTHENFSPNFFRLHPHASMIYRGLGQVVGAKFRDVGKWASVCFDSQAGRDAAASFEAGYKTTGKKDAQFAAPVLVAPTAPDFKVEITNLMNSDVEGLYLGILVGPAIAFLQQARSVGLTKKLRVIGEGGTDLVIARAMKQNTPENLWSPGAWYPDAEPFKSGAFAKAVYEKYVKLTGDKYPVGLTASIGHRCTLGLLEGMKKAGSTETAAVQAALKGLTFETLTGPYTIRAEDHQGYGQAVVANLGPSAAEPFYAATNVTFYDESTVLEPATPGVAFKF
ncbi:MAG: hypothetical protein BGP06_10525 [Rhizobiales bacterium 65-9]|nr:ABC transporter substrate-binding protein [Hyphomicrobiales bacterium]OJY32384.1 MAG: hypothetical protein BGP06_10525 [Rhizobiales bacterium 65-9]